MCLRAKTDPGFAKYPRLPVLDCRGYDRRGSWPGHAVTGTRG